MRQTRQWPSGCLTIVLLFVAASIARAGEGEKLAAEPKLTVVNASSHCDWGWKHSRAWHEERYAGIIRGVLKVMREHPDYVWQLENENDQLSPFLKKAGKEWPGLVDEFWRRVRQGRIEVIVGISNPRITEVYPETFVRNLVLGKQYYRRHVPGIQQKVYNATDVMCGHSQIPQILTGAGYRYFMFTRPMGPQVVFWRKGLDGTRMLSSRNIYGGPDRPRGFGRVVKGIQPVPICRISVSGDEMLPSAKLAAEAETWDPNKKILATNARYFEEVEKYGDRITELDGVLDSLEHYSEGGMHGNHSLYTRNNQNEDLLLCLEKTQVMASALGGSFSTEAMDRLWHEVLSCTCHGIQYIWTDDYNERMQKASQTRSQGKQTLHDAMAAVARGIRFRSETGLPLVVFNFHGWPVTGPVELTLDGEWKGVVIRDGAGSEIPMQLVGNEGTGGRHIAFIAENVPACGYKTFYLRRHKRGSPVVAPTTAGFGAIENEHYRVEMQQGGKLKIFDKARGVVLGSPEQGGLGELVFYDAPPSRKSWVDGWVMLGPLGQRHATEVESDQCRYSQGPVFASLRAEGKIGPHLVTRQVRLWHGSRRIDYLVEIDAKDGCGVFCIRFPLGLPDGRVFAGIPFGAEPRENFQNEPFREEFFNKGYPHGYYATRWTDVSNNKLGYTFVCPPGMFTGYSYDRRGEGALEFILLRSRPIMTLLRKPPPADNPTYGQAHPSITGKGRHTWRCSLIPHQGTWREAASFRDALEQHVPLLAFSPKLDKPSAGSRLDDETSFAEITPTGVVLSALRLVELEKKGKAPQWELRLYETLGKPADVVVRLGCKVSDVQETNLLGEPTNELGKIDVAGNEIRFRIQPWRIVTLRVTPAVRGL